MLDRSSLLLAVRHRVAVVIDQGVTDYLEFLYSKRRFFLLIKICRHLKATSILTEDLRFLIGFFLGRAGSEIDARDLMNEGLLDALLSKPFDPRITIQILDYGSRYISLRQALDHLPELVFDDRMPASEPRRLRQIQDCGHGGGRCAVIGEPPGFATDIPDAETSPPLYVLELSHCTVRRCGYGTFVFQGGEIVRDVSGPYAELLDNPTVRQKFFSINRTPPIRVEGTAVLVADEFSGNNYAHWMLDHLTRLFLCFREESDISAIIAFQAVSNFHRDSIQLLLGRSVPIIDIQENAIVEANRLLTLSNIRSSSFPICNASRYIIREYSAFMRAAAEKQNPAGIGLVQRVYISRQHSRRKIINGHEVKLILQEAGFNEIFLEDLSVSQQILLFSQAACIFAPHGAGLANILFCRPGTHIYEYFSKNFENGGFVRISASLGLHHTISTTRHGTYSTHDIGWGEDLYIETSYLRQWLETLPPGHS